MKILEMFNNSRNKFVSSPQDWESDGKAMSEEKTLPEARIGTLLMERG